MALMVPMHRVRSHLATITDKNGATAMGAAASNGQHDSARFLREYPDRVLEKARREQEEIERRRIEEAGDLAVNACA
jgi:hypothetical protein